MTMALRKTLFSRLLYGGSQVFGYASKATEASPAGLVSERIYNTSHECELKEKDKLYSSLKLELRGIDPAVLKSFSWFASTAANNLGIEVGNCWVARKAYHDRITLLKSVHIFKKHRVQYEIRTHFRYLNFHKLTGSTLDTFLEYIERNLPEGVALHASKVEIQEMPAHLKEIPLSE